MTSIQDKQAKLVNSLIIANKQRRLTWEQLENGNGAVYAEVNGKVIVVSDYSSNGTDSIKLEIYTDNKLAESFLDDDLSTADVVPVGDGGWYTNMTALLEQSRRLASSADEVLDSLLKDLEA